MYIQVSEILKLAQQRHTAAIAFICKDYIMARTVVYAAEAVKTPAIIMLLPEHAVIQKTTGFAGFAAGVQELAQQVKIPIALHCDHDFNYENVMRSIDCGFTSVMMDGSMHDLDTNIRLTKAVVETAHTRGVVVEGEIGHVGLAADSDNQNEDLYTKPDTAAKFCKETGVDSLAVSIGNAHGAYKQTPHLDIQRLEEIRSATDVPLVLHGGSGIPDDQLLEAFSKGICKFNLGTDYLNRYYSAVEKFVQENQSNPDPIKILNLESYVQGELQPYVEERLTMLCHF